MNRIITLLWTILLLAGPSLAQEAAEPVAKGLTGLGWIFMICSIAGVWALAIFCYKKLLFED